MKVRKVLPAVICLLCASAATGMAQGAKNAAPGASTAGWPEFVKHLSKVYLQQGNFEANVNAAFSGKKATWTGKVLKADNHSSFSLEMKPDKIVVNLGGGNTGNAAIQNLEIRPEGAEAKAWAAVSVGDTVSFTTTIIATGSPKCVVSSFVMSGPEGVRDVLVFINTKGGALQKVESPARK